MIVRLHLERRHPPVADVDHAGVLAGTLNDTRPSRRELLKMHAARFVRAVLRPHHRKNPELRVVWRASKDLFDALVFVGCETVRGDDVGSNGRLVHGPYRTQKITPLRSNAGRKCARR